MYLGAKQNNVSIDENSIEEDIAGGGPNALGNHDLDLDGSGSEEPSSPAAKKLRFDCTDSESFEDLLKVEMARFEGIILDRETTDEANILESRQTIASAKSQLIHLTEHERIEMTKVIEDAEKVIDDQDAHSEATIVELRADIRKKCKT